jgi:phosphoribosylaminoimidazolecarboxamide formyltransferase/IMP cyclohydrolase
MKTALISVYNKNGIVEFVKELVRLDFNILASGGTAKELSSAGIKVADVASLVGGGAILGHRVVTLSREIHAGLLARDVKEDRDELEKLKIPWIDLVCVDLYPLEQEIAKWDRETLTPNPSPKGRGEGIADEARDAVIEKTDVGGPTMLRSAAKGRRIVVCDPSDRMRVIEWLKNGEADKENFISSLVAKSEAVVADYCLVSARYHSAGKYEGMVGRQIAQCKYGENGYQTPAGLYGGQSLILDPLSLTQFKVLAGTAPSYNNWADVDRLLQTMTHIAAGVEVNKITLSALRASPPEGENSVEAPMIAVGVKHGNPCGAAVSGDPSVAIQKMLEGDLRAIFGGLVMVNFPVDEKLAEVLLTHKMESGRRLLDGIIAPSFTSGAIDLLKRKGDKCRFLVNPALANLSKNSIDSHQRFRYVRGGFLAQPNYTFVLDLARGLPSDRSGSEAEGNPRPEVIGKLSDQQKSDLILAWAIGSTSNSNTVTLVKDGMLIGNGVGQQDRVGCCQLAIKRATDAGHQTKDAVAYSDSFFPFVDGVQTLADAGIKAIFATSGSVRDKEVKDFCREKNISLYMLPDSEVRGFFGH